MALQLPLGGMQDVLDIYPKFEIDSDGYLSVDMRGMDNKGKEKELDTLLESMVLMIKVYQKIILKYKACWEGGKIDAIYFKYTIICTQKRTRFC